MELKFEEVQTENTHIKEINTDLKTRLDSTESKLFNVLNAGKEGNKNGDSQDIGTILKLSTRLQEMIDYNNDLKEENSTLRKVNHSKFHLQGYH